MSIHLCLVVQNFSCRQMKKDNQLIEILIIKLKPMKRIHNLKTVALLIGVFWIVSCEKSDLINETNQSLEIEEVQKSEISKKNEGFKSTTGHDGEILKNFKETVSPVLKVHFDDHVPLKEAMLKFDKEVKDYLRKQARPINKDFSTEWYYRVWVKTGTQTYNETDGPVGAYIRFTTSAGGYTPAFNWMNDAGSSLDGGYDGYLFRGAIPGAAVEWVEVDYGHLYLKGMNGWFVKEFICQLWESDQTIPATGFSEFWSYPNVWLDNDNADTWDYYYSGNIGTGRINF